MPAPLAPAPEAEFGKLHALDAFQEVERPRRVLHDVADEVLPLGAESVGEVGVVGHPVPLVAVVGVVLQIGVPHRLGRDRAVLDAAGTQTRHGAAELVTVVEASREAAGRGADLLVRLHGAVGVEEEDPDRALIGGPVVIAVGADSKVGDPVAVEVAERGDGDAEEVARVEGAAEAAGRLADLLLGGDRAVGVHEQDPDRSLIATPVVVIAGADGEVADPVAVQVAE